MRLTQKQVQSLFTALDPFLQDHEASLYLYGSRTQDHLQGGDIDLALLVKSEQLSITLIEKKHILLAAIKKLLGEQKIDLAIAPQSEVESDPFLKIILPTAILLHRWSREC